LEAILDATYDIWHEGLSRTAYGRYYRAQVATPWGRRNLTRLALVEGGEVVASGKLYTFDAALDGRPVRVAGLGAIFTQPRHRGRGAGRELVERMLDHAAAGGADLALLFSEIGADYYARLGFTEIPTKERTLGVAEPVRGGAPATMVRAGEDRDLAAIVAMGESRALPYRFHLDRDRDLVHYAIAKKRLLAGLGPPGVREVHFFVAEEGASAAAYVVMSAKRQKERKPSGRAAREWTLEECGDRDPAGARVGAILQVLIARDPAERRPTLSGSLPSGFLPPQLSVAGETPSRDVMMVRALSDRAQSAASLREDGILYWRGDRF
jgi:GNAT superfamily N-acetyltransferase